MSDSGPSPMVKFQDWDSIETSYREALDKHIDEDPDLIKTKEGINALVINAREGWAEAVKARKSAAWAWAIACLSVCVSLVFLLALMVAL